jgi:hypothetical protein
MRNAPAVGRLVPRPSRQPDANADGPDLRHPLGQKTEAIIENVSDDQRVRQGKLAAGTWFGGPATCRKALKEKELPARVLY